MVLFEAPYRAISFKRQPYVKCTVNLTPLLFDGLYRGMTMRTVFNIEIKTDIPAHDEERRKAFIELFMRASRTLFTQTAMLSKGVSPTIKVTSIDNDNGEEEYPLFASEEKEERRRE